VAVWIVDRKGANLLRNAGRLGLVFLQETLALEHLERIRCGSPEQVRLVVVFGLFKVLHARVGIAVLYVERHAWVGLLEGFLDGIGYVLRKGGRNRHLSGRSLSVCGADAKGGQGECRERGKWAIHPFLPSL